MPRAKQVKTDGNDFAKNVAALIGALAALIAALGGFIQVTHVGGLGFAVEAEESAEPSTPPPSPSTPPPSPTTPSPTRTTPPPTATIPPRVCFPATLGTTIVTVTSVEPTWNDFRIDIGLPFSGSKLRFSQDTRTVRIGVKIDNTGSSTLSLSAQNWRLFDGTSYAFASPAPSPSPAYVTQSIAPGRSFSGFVTFSAVPRSTTALSFEAKFSGQSTVYKLPTSETKC